MEPISTLIVDDERAARRTLRDQLEQDPEICVVGEAMDGERALELIRSLRPRLVFLDVQMPLLNGPDMLSRLPAEERPVIVFVTAYDQYALSAFDLHAVDYLLKPFSNGRLTEALGLAKQRVRHVSLTSTEYLLRALLERLPCETVTTKTTPAARLVVKADGLLHFLMQRDIRWVEGQGDFVRIHLKEHRLLARMTMNRMEHSLDSAQFIRIHKSSIVNLGSIRRIVPMLARSQGMELDDGTTLPIGPSYRGVLDRLR